MKRAFTLIELLVVISIIALLSSIVFASLNSARDKGEDAAIKANLQSARTSSALYESNVGSFSMICTASTQQHYIGPFVQAAEVAYGITPSTYADATASTWNTGQCHDNPTQWVAWVPLRDSTVAAPRAWCVDYTGTSKLSTVVLGSAIMICP